MWSDARSVTFGCAMMQISEPGPGDQEGRDTLNRWLIANGLEGASSNLLGSLQVWTEDPGTGKRHIGATDMDRREIEVEPTQLPPPALGGLYEQ